MRSKYPRMAAAIAATAIFIAVLAGCSSNSNNEDEKSDTYTCSQASESGIESAENKVTEAEEALAEAVPFKKKDAEATLSAATLKVADLKEQAAKCSEGSEVDAETASTSDIEACGDARFEQVFIDRAATAKVDPRYEGEVRPIITNAGLTDQQKMDAIIDVELKLAASNAQTLAFWAYGAGLYEDPNDWPELVEGGKIEGGECLTDKGKMLWSKYEGAITAKGVTLAVSEANPNSTNTGINGDTAVIDIQTGISGDMMTIVITFADGSQMKKMVRCGNLELPGVPPGIPPGKTDNPEKNPALDPSQTGNLPVQQQPNPLPARPDHYQPNEPVNPPSVYVPPAGPPPTVPGPVTPPGGGPTVPAPTQEPTPIVVPDSEAPTGPPPSTCSPAPGRSC